MTDARFDEIAGNFEFLEDWEDRYRYVIELGKEMPELAAALRVDATKVEGCASQVWIVPEIDGHGPSAQLSFQGDSDAMIVRGLIAILITLYSGKSASEILSIDPEAAFKRLGLSGHLSAQRSNGLRAMVARIRGLATKAEGQAA
ncbi:MAG: SufE family protein [Pseudomonadota bacterium]